MKRVLVVAYYFPPMGLSGVQRVSKFVKYLPQYGWQPVVLTVDPGTYFAFDKQLLEEVSTNNTAIYRTWSLDPTRLFGRRRVLAFPGESSRNKLTTLSQIFFVPDNKIGWAFSAIRRGKKLIRQTGFNAIFSSAPPYTSHLVGAYLSRWSGLPLVTDFRDDWVENPRHFYPTSLHLHLNKMLERWVLGNSKAVTAINDHIRQSLDNRFKQDHDKPFFVLPQGFDEEDFHVDEVYGARNKMRLLYSGIFYDAQVPDIFLKGLALLCRRRPEVISQIEAVFVGLVPSYLQEMAKELGVEKLIRVEGYQSHQQSVAFLKGADVLWMTIGKRKGASGISTGKLYEYMGARKPILALVPEGEARDALLPYRAATIVEPDDFNAVSVALENLFDQWFLGNLPQADEKYTACFDRKRLTGELAGYLDNISDL